MATSYNDPVPRYPRAVLYLPARLVREGGGHRLVSRDLPEGLRLGMSAPFARFARRVLGEERVFVAYPRTDREGRLTRLELTSAHERPPEGFAPGEGEAVGRVVLARKRALVLEVARRAIRAARSASRIPSGSPRCHRAQARSRHQDGSSGSGRARSSSRARRYRPA